MKALIGGGCKMGKSTLAQRVAMLPDAPRYYIATMAPSDGEDLLRIERHRAQRSGLGFQTVECPKRIERLADALPPNASLLVDSTTALLSGEMFMPSGKMDQKAPGRTEAGLLILLRRFENIVFVTDTIDSDGMRYSPSVEAYRQGLARIDQALAALCDVVAEMCVGIPVVYKGAMPKALAKGDAPV